MWKKEEKENEELKVLNDDEIKILDRELELEREHKYYKLAKINK